MPPNTSHVNKKKMSSVFNFGILIIQLHVINEQYYFSSIEVYTFLTSYDDVFLPIKYYIFK